MLIRNGCSLKCNFSKKVHACLYCRCTYTSCRTQIVFIFAFPTQLQAKILLLELVTIIIDVNTLCFLTIQWLMSHIFVIVLRIHEYFFNLYLQKNQQYLGVFFSLGPEVSLDPQVLMISGMGFRSLIFVSSKFF